MCVVVIEPVKNTPLYPHPTYPVDPGAMVSAAIPMISLVGDEPGHDVSGDISREDNGPARENSMTAHV